MHAAVAIRATIGCWPVVLACAVGSGCDGAGMGEPDGTDGRSGTINERASSFAGVAVGDERETVQQALGNRGPASQNEPISPANQGIDEYRGPVSFSGPDGLHLAWLESARPHDTSGWIVLADSDGRHPRRLGGRVPISPFVWSPDGRRLVYEHDEVLRVVDIATGAARIVDDRNARGPAWRPDGALTWRDSELGIAILPPGATSPRSLVPPSSRRIPFGLDWSPDGQRLAYAENDERSDTTRVVTVDADGSGRSVRSDPGPGGTDAVPRWSPDDRSSRSSGSSDTRTSCRCCG